jgi:hypothetical protein
MPPNLPAVLTSLGARPSREAFEDVTALLGGSPSPLAGIRRNRLAEVDASEFPSLEVAQWLVGLPISPDADVRVAWAADRTGTRMKFATFAGHVSDLWFPRWTMCSFSRSRMPRSMCSFSTMRTG